MARGYFNNIKSFTQAETLATQENAELAKQQRAYLRNSDRSFTWGQVAKYSGMIFGAVVGGLSFAVSNAILNPPAAGAAAGGIQGFIAATGPGLMISAVAISAVLSLAATYISYRISANNSLNANEINASSTGREIAAELRKEPIEVSLSPPELQHPNARPIQYFDTAGEAALLNDASNDKAYDTPSLQIATADAELLSRINEMDLEPLSHTR